MAVLQGEGRRCGERMPSEAGRDRAALAVPVLVTSSTLTSVSVTARRSGM